MEGSGHDFADDADDPGFWLCRRCGRLCPRNPWAPRPGPERAFWDAEGRRVETCAELVVRDVLEV